jgi:hypothetical protein
VRRKVLRQLLRRQAVVGDVSEVTILQRQLMSRHGNTRSRKEVTDDRGHVLPGLCLAGPDGEDFRKRLREDPLEDGLGPPHCVRTFEASSHFEAMTIYYRH